MLYCLFLILLFSNVLFPVSELRPGMPELSKFNALPFIAHKNMSLPLCALEKVNSRIPSLPVFVLLIKKDTQVIEETMMLNFFFSFGWIVAERCVCNGG